MKAIIPFTVALHGFHRQGMKIYWSVTLLENTEAGTRLVINAEENLTQALMDDIIAEEIALLVAKTA